MSSRVPSASALSQAVLRARHFWPLAAARGILREMKRCVIFWATTLPVMIALIIPVSPAGAQDTRNVGEPKIPQTCAVLVASLSRHGGTLAESDESKLDTARIQT